MMEQLLPWHWRSLPLNNRTGSEIFEDLFLQPNTIATLLESPFSVSIEQSQLSRYSICAGSPRFINNKPQLWTPKKGEIIPFLRSLIQQRANKLTQTSIFQPYHLPFIGGWLGWLSYDFAWEIERLPIYNRDPLPFPLAYWYEPESFAILDHKEQTLWLAARDSFALDKLQNQLESDKQIQNTSPSSLNNHQLSAKKPHFLFLTSQTDYQNAVHQAKKYIQAGDIFQANLSVRFQTYTTAESWATYRYLQTINPSPFASYWQTPWGEVISCSPERLVQLQGNKGQTRPIAGTRSRGTNPQLDQQLAEELIIDVKERAEHIMLVDLERNDLGKVCEWGSVEVDELFTIEKYSHVMHLVSNVTGTLHQDYDAIDLICALFPGGTITGCPKVRCMEIIEELEPFRRGLFYGSCGYLDQRGNLDLNILIRTLLFSHYPLTSLAPSSPHSSIVWGQVGAGIVADSDPEKEWFESLHKAEAQLTVLRGDWGG